jgi:hypothetical protein
VQRLELTLVSVSFSEMEDAILDRTVPGTRALYSLAVRSGSSGSQLDVPQCHRAESVEAPHRELQVRSAGAWEAYIACVRASCDAEQSLRPQMFVTYRESCRGKTMIYISTPVRRRTLSIYFRESGDFDLFILGHSIPVSDKTQLIKAFHKGCDAPIITRLSGDE